jgi:chromosome segregation ATPase
MHKFKKIRTILVARFQAVKNSKEVYLEARNLKGEYLQLEEDYQVLEKQLDELLSSEQQHEDEVQRVRDEYKEILDAYESYHEKMKGYRAVFEQIEYFNDEMQAKTRAKI